MGVTLQPVQRQLDRFEECGVLVSREVGRTRLSTWNPKSPFSALLREMVKGQYESIPLEKRLIVFKARRVSNPRPPAYKAGAPSYAELRPHWDWRVPRIRPVAFRGSNGAYFTLKGVVR